MLWVVRCNRRTPSWRSSACKRRLMVGWVAASCSAAADKLPASTMRTKVCSSSMRSPLAPDRLWGLGLDRVMRETYHSCASCPTTHSPDEWARWRPSIPMLLERLTMSLSASPAGPAAHADGAHAEPLSASLILLLAISAGLSVASLHYSQPMLGILGADIHAPARLLGQIPTLTQLGYALGLLLLAPLGDRHDRRTVIMAKAGLLAGALLLAAAAPSIELLLAASLAVGLCATLAQDIVPAAATLAAPHQRGRVVGTVM